MSRPAWLRRGCGGITRGGRSAELASGPRATAWASLARAGYGTALLCAPGPVISVMTGGPVSRRARAVARVLGARHLVQAAVCGLVPARGLIRAGAAADGLHAASMLVLAVTAPGLRRALLADAVIAATLASASAGEAPLMARRAAVGVSGRA